MWEIEAVRDVRAFVETGGDVLFALALATAVMWTLILERLWYFMRLHAADRSRAQGFWGGREDHSSWYAHQVRRLLVSEVSQNLTSNLSMIRTIVALCPLLGLLGTVTGMIEVFDVMANGSGNARGMAGGVSKATLPTMAGLVASLSGLLLSAQLDRYAQDETERVADHLEIAHKPPPPMPDEDGDYIDE